MPRIVHFEIASDDPEKLADSMVTDKMSVAGVGWFCYFKDPQGNVHGMMQFDQSAT
jgi:hypothetical protein